MAIQRPSRTEGDAPEAAGDVAMGEDLLAGRHVPYDQVPFLGRLVVRERPRHGGDPRAVGAERHAVERLPGLAKGAEIEVTLAPSVIPLPAPEILGAAVEELQGSGDVVAEALAECEVDAADVVLPPQLFGPSIRIERVVFGDLAAIVSAGSSARALGSELFAADQGGGDRQADHGRDQAARRGCVASVRCRRPQRVSRTVTGSR